MTSLNKTEIATRNKENYLRAKEALAIIVLLNAYFFTLQITKLNQNKASKDENQI